MRILWLLFVLFILGALEVGIVVGKHERDTLDSVTTQTVFAVEMCDKLVFAATVNGKGAIDPLKDPTPDEVQRIMKSIPEGNAGVLAFPCHGPATNL